jgi:high-affinity iron transporter
MGNEAVFNVAIATIFAREVLEGAIIIGQYRTVIIKSDHWNDEFKQQALKTCTHSALFATFVAILVIIAVAIPLGILSQDLPDRTIELIEGTSKIVAAICILQLSLKMPFWLGLYEKVPLLPKKRVMMWCSGSYQDKSSEKDVGLTLKEIRFNVAWNIWREVAECGIFLIPFFLGTGASAIPLSALVGIAISVVLGAGIYIANNKMESKFWLAVLMAGLTLFLSVGLFVGGCHEFEEALGETRNVWTAENQFWSSKQLPMVILKPFGYSSSRSVLQITSFWLWLAFGVLCHTIKFHKTKGVRKERAAAEALEDEQDKLEKGEEEPTDVNGSDGETSSRPESEEEEAPVSVSATSIRTGQAAQVDGLAGSEHHA